MHSPTIAPVLSLLGLLAWGLGAIFTGAGAGLDEGGCASLRADPRPAEYAGDGAGGSALEDGHSSAHGKNRAPVKFMQKILQNHCKRLQQRAMHVAKMVAVCWLSDDTVTHEADRMPG